MSYQTKTLPDGTLQVVESKTVETVVKRKELKDRRDACTEQMKYHAAEKQKYSDERDSIDALLTSQKASFDAVEADEAAKIAVAVSEAPVEQPA